MNQVSNLPKQGDVVDWHEIISNKVYRGPITCWLGPNGQVKTYISVKAGPSLIIDIEEPENKVSGDVVYLSLLTNAGTFKIAVFSMSFGRVEGSHAIMLKKYDPAVEV